MKKVIIATALLVVGLNSFVKGQEKTSVGIMPFNNSVGYNVSGSVNDIYDATTNAFVKTKRFVIVDRSKMEELKQEKNLQKTEDFMDGKTIEQSKSLGAEFLISGNVSDISVSEQYNSEKKFQGYYAKISFTLKVIDVSTGQILSSDKIETSSGSTLGILLGSYSSTKEGAISEAINSISSSIDNFVAKNFPVAFPIVEIQEKDSKGNATKILIAGGSAFGLNKGDKLKVVEITEMEVNGKKMQRKKEIGELKITKVEDENFSTCSVKTGGIDINSKFEAKAKLQVITQN